MSLANLVEKIKQPAVLVGLAIILTGALGFGLGRLSRLEEGRVPVKFEWLEPSPLLAAPPAALSSLVGSPAAAVPTSGSYVASKSGKRYHLPWCPGAGQIKEENKIWFSTKEAAEAAGYTPAANCPGL